MTRVYLVGAGPGDPDLITVKGREALARADAVLYDNLANPALLDYCPPAAERLYVGKKRSAHAYTQREIGGLLIERARQGKIVVRLKGGDPYIFGRGGEEAEMLASAGVPFAVIPGVTAPLGVAAYCGVPLTHREHNSTVTLVSGHHPESVDWARVAHAETLVVYMGLENLGEIVKQILHHGRDPLTPAIAVRWATRPDQRVCAAPLGEIHARLEREQFKPPVTVIIGGVVQLHSKLGWYEKLPLFGKTVAVTRPRGQAEGLLRDLRALGADAIALPAIEIRPPESLAPLDAAIERLHEYDWLVFTSANGVRFFLERLAASPRDVRSVRGKLCAIGPATRAALAVCGLKTDLTAPEFVAESLLESFRSESMRGKRVLLARAAVARDVLPEGLRDLGALVDVAAAYQTVMPEDAAERFAKAFAGAKKPDWITFSSSSTVENLLRAAGRSALDGVKVASIGPVTTETLKKFGIHVDAEASVYTADGILAAILKGV